MWCIPEVTPEYVRRMEDVLKLYEKPLDPNQPVVCLDEKPVQLLEDVREPILPERSGEILKRDFEYKRKGTATIFCAVEPKRGRYLNKVRANRKAPQFAKMIKAIAKRYRRAETIHLVMDNLNTHCENSLATQFGKKKGHRLWARFKVHFTPKHASWLNQAEIGIGLITRQALGKERLGSRGVLGRRIRQWTKSSNKDPRPIKWRFTREKARETFKYPAAVRRPHH